jgi:NADH-quinone oxidoreductase subunit M
MIYDRYHTRQLDDLQGLAARLPLVAVAMVFISMASIGLPGLNGFVGEMLSLAGMFRLHPLYAVLGATGIVLGAWYLLGMIQHAFFGPLREPHVGEFFRNSHRVSERRDDVEPIADMNAREMLAIVPICLLCLCLGLMPQPVLELIRPDVDAVVALYENQDQNIQVAQSLTRVARDAAKTSRPEP